jgi:hypothetical protein
MSPLSAKMTHYHSLYKKRWVKTYTFASGLMIGSATLYISICICNLFYFKREINIGFHFLLTSRDGCKTK